MWNNFKEKYIGSRDFYRHIIFLALPMIGQNAVTSFVSLLDNFMVGRLGTDQMTGVAIVNQLMFVFQICVFGAVSGAGIFGTQYYGKGDYKGQKHAFRFKVYASMIIAALGILVFGFCSSPLIKLYLTDADKTGNIYKALEFGNDYAAVIIIGLIPFALCQAYVSSIRETGHTLIPMIASSVAVFVNLVLDIILIFGYLGLPKLGVVGAAIATVIARYIECIIVVVWTHRHKKINQYIIGAYKSLKINTKLLKDIFIMGTPLMLNEVLWSIGMTTVVQQYSVRGQGVVAALSISTTISNIFNIVYIQLGSCLAIVVGQQLGAGKIKKAKDTVNKMLFFSVMCCVIIGIIMILTGGLFPRIYNTESYVKQLASEFIAISALVMPFCAYAHCTYFALRSGGKTIITFIFDSLFTWVIMIPCAFILARYTNIAIEAVFFIVQFTEIIKVIIGYFMIRSEVWIQNIVE
ncbi:MAG: MATE family efflux transporter [Lachnospiraceae bacterium]|nr:MATE family efflux transporter [Lachnospiraceae bacterium]